MSLGCYLTISPRVCLTPIRAFWQMSTFAPYRCTRVYRGRQELIDHILVSKGLLGPTEELRHDHWRLKEVHSLVASITGHNIGDNPAELVGKERPDHAPVYARFGL